MAIKQIEFDELCMTIPDWPVLPDIGFNEGDRMMWASLRITEMG